ncbi:MAG: hypothetical protein V3V46_09895 [Anaerolineales bacterium]
MVESDDDKRLHFSIDGHAPAVVADGPRPIGMGQSRLTAACSGSISSASLALAVSFTGKTPAGIV